MASISKHPKSKYWYACFTDEHGKQRKKSTGLTNRKLALKIADELETMYQRKMAAAQIRKVFTEVYRELYNEELPSSTIRDFLNDWVKRKENEVSRTTFEKYRKVAERFNEHLADASDHDLNYLTAKHIIKFRDEITGVLSPGSVNGHLKILRVALNDAWRDDLITENPVGKVPKLKTNKTGSDSNRRPFTAKELRKLLKTANGEWLGIVLTGLYTGQRLGDIARLKWANVDLEEKELGFISGKTNRPTLMPMASPLFDHILSLNAPDNPELPVFPNAFAVIDKHGRTGHLSNQFYDIMVAAGLAEKRRHRKKKGETKTTRTVNPLSFHSLRHTLTSLLKNSGVSDSVAMDIIGHESKAISQNYTHIDKEAKKKAMEGLPNLTK